MTSRMKEDEKNEARIRRLLKLPENKRCINCNSLGPQYVCTTFSTFVCTQCSGVQLYFYVFHFPEDKAVKPPPTIIESLSHPFKILMAQAGGCREFSHRIKSVSMAKFTGAEVSALQAGGNEHARAIFFRDMDPVRNPLPDSGSPDKLREFIKRVYVDRRYSGDRPPIKARQEEESRRPDLRVDRSLDSQSLSFEDRMDERRMSGARKSDVDRNYLDEKRSPSSFEPSGRPARRSYDERDGSSEERSSNDNSRERPSLSRPFSFRDFDSTPPPVMSMKDILGDIPGLHLEIYKQSNGNLEGVPPRSQGSTAEVRRNLQSQSFGAVSNDRVSPAALAHKRINSASLIDLNGEANPVGSAPTGDPFAEPNQGGGTPSTSNSWATFMLSPSPPAPTGYSTPKNEAEAAQWAGSGWPQAQSAGNAWSAFGVQSSPSPVAEEELTQEQHSAVSSSKLQTSPRLEPQARREIPQDFFAPSFQDGRFPTLDMHQRQQVPPALHPQQLDAPTGVYYAAGGISHNLQPQLQPQLQTPRSRNPFDDDDDESSTHSATAATMQFPSMDSLQAVLPTTMPVNGGIMSMGTTQAAEPQSMPVTTAASHWSYSFPQFNEPTSSAGVFNYGSDQMASTFQLPTFLMQPDTSGAYMAPHPFIQEVPYPGNQFYSQNVVRPAGGNPFG